MVLYVALYQQMKTPKALRHHNDKVGRGNSSGLVKVRDGQKKQL